MSINRRSFLKHMTASSVIAGVYSRSSWANEQTSNPSHLAWTPGPQDIEPGSTFRHGVASGDPLVSRVVLWTRVTPKGFDSVKVICRVSLHSDMSSAIKEYTLSANQQSDFTVKIDAAGLSSDTVYYFQFYAENEASVIGRTRTLPYEADRVRLAVASCSNLPAGFFGAYGLLAKQSNLNAVLHLGDYIYEYENGTYGDGSDIGRIPEPNRETVYLNDYRARYSQYRRDENLQEAHRLHPWIMVWDDHEFADNAYKDGAGNHDDSTEGSWALRKAMARKAYFEWMPIRDPYGYRSNTGRIFRRFRFADLVQLDMIDTRIYGRETVIPFLIDGVSQELIVSPSELMLYIQEMHRSDRQLLGKFQERWLFRQLEIAERRDTLWHVVGQQMMIGQLSVTSEGLPPGIRIPINPDQWDGYEAARQRFLYFLKQQGINNTLFLSGDFDSSWSNDIALNPYDSTYYDPHTGVGSQAVEFVAPAISSPFFVDPVPELIQGLENYAMSLNPHTHYVDLTHNGYLIVDIDRYRAKGDWFYIDDVLNPSPREFLAATVEVNTNSQHGVLAG